jgi:hypothetical protein
VSQHIIVPTILLTHLQPAWYRKDKDHQRLGGQVDV